MRSATHLILNAFLSRQSEERRSALIGFLPEKEQKALATLPSYASAPPLEAHPLSSLLSRIHWSWLVPVFQAAGRPEQALYLSALDPEDASSLAEHLQIPHQPESLTPLGKTYLRQAILDNLAAPHDQLVPLDYLPPSPLNRLLHLSKNELVLRIDLLAMHDLAAEMRQIVETKILKKIYSALSEEQRSFLKKASSRHDPPGQKIGLEHWEGSEETLKRTLHKRGLARLGLALSLQDPALVWYVCHQLDTGRGNTLFTLSTREGGTFPAETALKQVEQLLESLP